MKLLCSLTSPFARKVRVALMEKRIDCEIVVDSPWEADTAVPEFNPLGKVPVLVLDDGTTLFDSRVIVEYLDSVSPVSRLLPDVARQRIFVRRWEALADGVADAAAAIFLERKRPKGQQSADWITRQQNKITLGVRAMAQDLGEKAWCSGEGYSLADIAVGCALGYLDFRFPSFEWREKYSGLSRLSEKLLQRPSFKDTLPPPA